MDKKKTLIQQARCLLTAGLLLATLSAFAQATSQIQFCDKKYDYAPGRDTITLFFNFLDAQGKRQQNVSMQELQQYLVVKEDGQLIAQNRYRLESVSSGQRIPSEFTFSVLVDQSIPEAGKQQIFNAVGKLVEAAPDGCVYLSFFGDDVTPTIAVNRSNYQKMQPHFTQHSDHKFFYSGLMAKLAEFAQAPVPVADSCRTSDGYKKNVEIARRAAIEKDKNILFVFTEGSKRPDDEDITFVEVTDYQVATTNLVPRVYALYYTEDGAQPAIETTLKGVCSPLNAEGHLIKARAGSYMPSNNMEQVLANFQQVVNDAMYDYAFAYTATPGKVYSGTTEYTAEWKGVEAGTGHFSIGSAERPWPDHPASTGDSAIKFIIALLVTLLTAAFFFAIAKIIVPLFRSKTFEMKYYRQYVPQANVQSYLCMFCGLPIEQGQHVVQRCKHIMHVECWKQNGYKCAEYGQNCNTGIQPHVDWKDMFSRSSLRDSYQTIAGIGAGFVSWVIYELAGRGSFHSLASSIAGFFFTNETQRSNLLADCEGKTSAFLTIGLLLGFFLSLIFRYNDEYRSKDWKTWLKIIGLSVLTGLIGMAAFAVGAVIFCSLLSAVGTTYIPWYCSLPAYLLFSISVALALTIKSTVPVKSALIGGLISAVIGFIVLYFSDITSRRWGWMNMLLDFIIYGGGLGASLVTVRMLAEKYFLVIVNGVRAGQRIPIHKWMNALGGGNKVNIGMTGECEIQMNWEKSNKVAKQHVQLFIDHDKKLPMMKPLATGVVYNNRTELPVNRMQVLSNGDTFKVGDTIFKYDETN